MSKLQTEGDNSKIVSQVNLHNTIAALLEAIGLSAEDAGYVADSMTLAHLRGIDTHGIRSLVNYVNRFKKGSLNKTPVLRIEKETEISALIDGDNGLGHVIGTKAMKIAIEKAKKQGIGLVALNHTNHYGMAAYFSMLAQKEGLIGFTVTTATPRMAPTGGKTVLYGNNPFSFAFPNSDNEVPVVVDMATSVVAGSNVSIAKKLGKKIPLTWALDSDGKPTEDPNEVAILQPFGGYKGYAISLVGEAFASVLSGALIGIHAGPITTEKPEGQNIGQFFMAMDPGMFVGKEEFVTRFETFAHELKSSELAEGSNGVFLPGEMEYNRLRQREESGIPINKAFIDDLASICSEYGVDCSL